MTDRAQEPVPQQRTWMQRLKQFWPVLPLAVILFALMLSDLDVMGYTPLSSNPCSFQEVDQSGISARIYAPLAQRALKATAGLPVHVAIVTIDANTEPPGLLTNTCDSRNFLARLVGSLNTLGARVIVIDKYYFPDSCVDAVKTANFVHALATSAARVVVGQATHALANTSEGCLALTPGIDFNQPGTSPAEPHQVVLSGLNRLNSDTLKIPLRWPVFNEPAVSAPPIQAAMSLPAVPVAAPTPVTPASKGDGLALVAAEAYDPTLSKSAALNKFLGKTIVHPYTTFFPLPTANAMTALCNADPAQTTYGTGPDSPGAQPGQADLCTPWLLTPDKVAPLKAAIAGNVVVIGDLSDQDVHPFPGGDQPGVFLQANYVQSILDRRFLEEIPFWLTLTLLVLYVFLTYCLYWSHDKHGEPHLTAEQAGLGSLGVLAVLIAITLFALLRFHYFTPLWALWGSGVFMIFRYLEASGHHRSQHLLGQLSGETHHAEHASHAKHAATHHATDHAADHTVDKDAP